MSTAAMQRASGAHWRALAADVIARFPLAGTDWDQHSDAVEARFYNVRKRTETPPPADPPNCVFAEEPLSPDEEEQLATLF